MTRTEQGSNLVLIADDDPSIRLLVSATLASDQFSVLQAADGDEAWRLIREYHPAVAILDWQMPVYDGLELTAVIKGDPQLQDMTVIMLTARSGAADRAAAARAEADMYLTKPFSTQGLLDAVKKALGIHNHSPNPPQTAVSGSAPLTHGSDTERSLWLTEARGVIEAWKNRIGDAGRSVSLADTALLTERIAAALQQADEAGMRARAH